MPVVPEQPDRPEADVSEPEWKRRSRREAVFGDVLPETTSDERDAEPPAEAEDEGDRWLRSQVPPHHG
jgi:hypothetical protein